jgi:hypothetical protein
MINSVKRKIKQVGERKIYEIGSRSDMVLEKYWLKFYNTTRLNLIV